MTTDGAGTGVVWFRRDLRLHDNPAWAQATAAHDSVVAVFVLEPRLLERASEIRRNQLLAHLHALDASLHELGGRLVIRTAPADAALLDVARECHGAALYLNSDHSPFSRRRDAAVHQLLGIPIHTLDGGTVHPSGAIRTARGTLSQVFTSFYNTWRKTPPAEWPEPGAGKPVTLAGDSIPRPSAVPRLGGGEAAAWERLTTWLERVDDYPDSRDVPALDGTSDLSSDLKFGTLAARTVMQVVGDGSPGRVGFVRQLAWRDWWAHTLAERGDLADRAIVTAFDRIEWRDAPDELARWCHGATGYPIVDAGMRQLTSTGWMHNRVRMICASFLVKDLLIDWRRGERFFRHHLVDADVAQNAGNWQWVAGTGPDAAPYFRIFNPTAQGRKFDPDGEFVRRWLPELGAMPTRFVHEPAEAPADVLADAGVQLDVSYPSPIVQHGAARARAIDAYRRALQR